MERNYDLKKFWKDVEDDVEDLTPNVPAVTGDDVRAKEDPNEILFDDSVFVDDESDPDE